MRVRLAPPERRSPRPSSLGGKGFRAVLAIGIALLVAIVSPAHALDLVETPMLAGAVAEGRMPPVAERVPAVPAMVDLVLEGREPGRPGGEIAWLASRARDIRIMNVYGYARLVGYAPSFELFPDLLRAIEVEDDRVFTLHLRPGHRWSDGAPFTTVDFRYAWFDMALNQELRPYGPDDRLIVEGEAASVEIIDPVTVRYSWSRPNPRFLPALAAPNPLYIFAPAHYLRQFHPAYTDPETLARRVAESGERNWTALHIRRGNLYEADNPDLPTLEPWRNTTPPPSDRFVFERNPYYHRVDAAGHQLPYLDRVIVNIADASLIPAKTGAGESDLQARSLRFDNISFLMAAAERGDFRCLLWPTALGSEIALYPNLNANDPVWRALNRDVRYRRALSLGINREEINQVVFFGLATPGNNTALPQSPLFDAERLQRWAIYDPDRANALLDEIGLTERDGSGIRLLPDGRRLEVIAETSGERSVETDVLQLITDTWRTIGVALYIRSSQRDVFRNRIFSGDVAMSVWFGFDNALFTANSVPGELAPVDQNALQYPKWGQWVQTGGAAGEPPDMDFALSLMDLYRTWMTSADRERRAAIVSEMLDIHADQVTSIGLVQGVLQPIVVSNRLHNVPEDGIYSWDPGAHFGMYRPDTFWVAE